MSVCVFWGGLDEAGRPEVAPDKTQPAVSISGFGRRDQGKALGADNLSDISVIPVRHRISLRQKQPD